MRTAIFLGLSTIGAAINPTLDIPENTAVFGGVMMVAFIIMDVIEFSINMTKK